MRHNAHRPILKRTLHLRITSRSLKYELRDKNGLIEIGNKPLQAAQPTLSHAKIHRLLERVKPHSVLLPNTRLKSCRLGEASKKLVREVRQYCRTTGIKAL